MNRPSAYYLLLLYIVAVCKPFLPVVNDVLAHAFWEQEHITAVHQHQGGNHLQGDLNKAAKQENADTNTNNKTAESLAVHLPSQYRIDFCAAGAVLQKPLAGVTAITSIFLETHTPPPKGAA